MKITNKLLALICLMAFTFSCQNEEIEEPTQEFQTIVSEAKKADFNTTSYLVISSNEVLPNNIESAVAKSNGTVTAKLSEVGVAVVESFDKDFMSKASKIKGIQSVVPNLTIQWLDPNERTEAHTADFGNPPNSGDDDFFFDLQWGHDAVDAPEAWNEGYRGAGVRVGVIDGGFDLTHPDLSPNINYDLSMDFTGEGLQYALPGIGSHGSHTAGTIGAADNGFGIIGIAPEVELVLLKALGDAGSGSIGAILNAIIYAANNEVDVINMSLGSTLSRRGGVYNSSGEFLGNATARAVAEYLVVYNRVTGYAYRQGTTIIASAGNAATDYDHSKDLIHLPSGLSHVISISATAPFGWAKDPSVSLDNLASYSNFGQSEIDFAAPGGDFQYAFTDEGLDICNVAGINQRCFVFDYVFSAGNGGWYWSVGTSMAAPHATGVAAIIIGKNGGSMKPAQVEAALRASADDLGKPGKDDAYGHGRVNAYNAVRN